MSLVWYIISGLRTIIGFLMMVVWMIGYSITLLFRKHSKDTALTLREHYLKWVAFPLFGLRTELKGTVHSKPALYVANHRSFSDPMIICRYLRAFVVAKAEIANYPVISQGAQLTGVLFVKREDKNSRSSVRQAIVDTIKRGHNILVFPEGTVGVKRGTLDFKVGAFVQAIKNDIPIIPIALEYKSPKDLWVIPNFIRQFLIMYSKSFTRTKMTIGKPIIGSSVEDTVAKARDWIENELKNMQEGWTEIEFDQNDND